MNAMASLRPTELRWCRVQRITVAATPDETCRRIWIATFGWSPSVTRGCCEAERRRTGGQCRPARGRRGRRG